MQSANRYYKGRKRAEVTCRYWLRQLALALAAAAAARLTGRSVRAVKTCTAVH